MQPAPPWRDLPPGLADVLRPHLEGAVADVIEALPREVPAYARPLEGAFGEGLRLGVSVALARFLDLPGTSQPALGGHDRTIYFALGRGEMRQGRELEALLAAYRVGARVAFRSFATASRDAGLDAELLVPLAESVFAYIDELSAASAEGYAREQSLRAGESDRRRARLVGLLLAGTLEAQSAVEAAAAAGWALPERLRVVLVPTEHAQGLDLALGRSALVAAQSGSAPATGQQPGTPGAQDAPVADGVVALVPDPPRAAERVALSRRLAGRGAVIGTAVAWPLARTSLRLAGLAARLVEAGVLREDPVWVDEHLSTLLLHGDADLVAALQTRCLAPLEQVRESTRERLAETLLGWLQHRGERQHVAAALHVHPQTVAYRMTQLRELFGPALEDPTSRFELELALRSRTG